MFVSRTLLPPVRAVVFDIGETVIDKSREYAAWAVALGTTPHTFSAVFGAAVLAGSGAAAAITAFDPAGLARYPELLAAGVLPPPAEPDLYPGVRALLADLQAAGLLVGVAGNQPPGYGAMLRELGLPADVVATSDEWGVGKPDAEFFVRVVTELSGVRPVGSPPLRLLDVVHVGDQLDADVVAPSALGMRAIRVLQGPWGRLRRDAGIEATCLAVVERVADVRAVLLEQPE